MDTGTGTSRGRGPGQQQVRCHNDQHHQARRAAGRGQLGRAPHATMLCVYIVIISSIHESITNMYQYSYSQHEHRCEKWYSYPYEWYFKYDHDHDSGSIRNEYRFFSLRYRGISRDDDPFFVWSEGERNNKEHTMSPAARA